MISSSTCNVPFKYRIYPNVREFFPNSSHIKLNVFCIGIFPKNEDCEQEAVIQAEYLSNYGKPKHCVSMSNVLCFIYILVCINQSQNKTETTEITIQQAVTLTL